MHIKQNGILLTVSIQSEPVRTVCTSVQLAGRTKGRHCIGFISKRKLSRHQITIDDGTDEKLVDVLLVITTNKPV